jgi:branched-chain amino acid transport system substrate-binding protein
MKVCHRLLAAGTAIALAATIAPATAQEINVPVIVPVTGILSIEGKAQRNGALLAIRQASDVSVKHEVIDTGSSPAGATNAIEKALSEGDVTAIAASIFGPEMLAMMPIALEAKVPLLTISGTAKITEMGNPYIFRFFPGDSITKVAHADYVATVLGKKKPAIIYQTTAYGQSGREHLVANLEKLGVKPVMEEALSFSVKDMLPVLTKARDAGADVLVVHLHSGPTALLVKQAAAMGLNLPIVAGSAMHQPTTAALLEPGELAGVCAESGSSPVSGGNAEMDAFLADYRKAFDTAPDAFSLGAYDGVNMALQAVKGGARTAEEVRAALSDMTYNGLAMTYKSDGKGNMAHSAVIMCYDGKNRIPAIVKRYENVSGVL